jgi:hypothetical protein
MGDGRGQGQYPRSDGEDPHHWLKKGFGKISNSVPGNTLFAGEGETNVYYAIMRC